MRKVGIMAAAFALAGLGSYGTSKPIVINDSKTHLQDVKSTVSHNKKSLKEISINLQGGLDFPRIFNGYSRSPKEYGQLFGCKKHTKKHNRLRFSHNAKLKRR
jgi:hypothetical protein